MIRHLTPGVYLIIAVFVLTVGALIHLWKGVATESVELESWSPDVLEGYERPKPISDELVSPEFLEEFKYKPPSRSE